MKQRTWVIVIFIVAIAANGVGYLVVKNRRTTTVAGKGNPPPGTTVAMVDSAKLEKEQLGRARRAAGLAALEASDYDRALKEFAEAQTLLGEKANVSELQRIAEDLRTRALEKPAPAPVVAAPVEKPLVVEAARPAPNPRGRPPARPPQRVAAVEQPKPEPVVEAKPTTGLLLVTTTPRGLVVQVDGAVVDMTPMRTSLPLGAHRVTLLDGERKLYERVVDISLDGATTIARDFSSEMAALAKPAPVEKPAPEPKPEPRVPEPKPEPIAAVQPKPEPKPEPRVPEPTPVPVAKSSTGGLDIQSPGLYAEIWVNERPYGFPPVAARNLPAGETRIEARVQGVVKRSTVVTVQAGQVLPVKVR